MAFLPGPLTYEQVRKFIATANTHQDKYGYTLWAAELKENNTFIGFIGLNYTDQPAPFASTVEVGWRLSAQYWNQGYATEGVKAAIDYEALLL